MIFHKGIIAEGEGAMRIAIVEDEAVYQQQLREYLAKYQEEFGCALQVSVYDSGINFVHNFSNQFDIILLDVAMPYIDGIETARRIREIDSDVVILFVTNQAQHAIRGYEVDALDYILKPISYFAFSQRLKRALSRVSRREEPFLVLNLKSGPRKLKISSIYYIEVKDHSLVYHTMDGDYSVFGSLKDAEQKLADYHFQRCSKAYLVSLRHVDNVQNGCAVVDGQHLLISRPRKSAFMEALTDYLGGGAR